ncbi:ankyrin [Mycena amicta]|nr:ankyrin [Mycena amicta]
MTTNPSPPQLKDLPQETIDFARRMFDAAREGNEELLVAAVERGLPVNLLNEKGNSLLMLAAYSGHESLTRALLVRGGDPNILNDNGQSIIAGAVFKGHDAVVRVLLDSGADPRIGRPSAIESASMFRKQHLLEVLGARQEDIGEDVPQGIPAARA